MIKTTRNFLTLVIPVLIAVCAVSIAAQEPNERLPPHIRTTGESIVQAVPDRARIDIGVVSQSESSETAASQNATKLEAVLTSLRNMLGANADIKTVSYTLTPNYRYPREGGEPTITGYTATNVVRITLDDLTQVGKVIDAATQTGANRIQQLQFTLKDERPSQAQALREASTAARQKADVLANSLGLKIVRVYSVIESSPVVIPVRDVGFARAEMAATTTPIEPGTIEVRGTVTLTVEVSQ